MTRAVGVTAVAALLGLGLSGCGAGLVTQTADMKPATIGVNLASEDQSVLIRDAAIVFPGTDGYPAGASAPITMVVVNQTNAPFRLVEAQTEFGPTTLELGWATVPPPSPTTQPSPPDGADPAPASPTGEADPAQASPDTTETSPAAAQSPTPTSPDGTQSGIVIPANGFTQLTVMVEPLQQAVSPIGAIPLQLVFDHTTVGPFDVPLAVPLEPVPRTT